MEIYQAIIFNPTTKIKITILSARIASYAFAGGRKRKEKIMSVSIREALQNADYNLQNNAKTLGAFAINLAKDQLHNAIVLLEKGYGLDEEVEPLLEKYGNVDDVPEKVEE